MGVANYADLFRSFRSKRFAGFFGGPSFSDVGSTLDDTGEMGLMPLHGILGECAGGVQGAWMAERADAGAVQHVFNFVHAKCVRQVGTENVCGTLQTKALNALSEL